ncbi:TonB-dependent receptor [Thalassolituus oleivorans]|uniref:TonB-dependent receptor n=1 Tax=Thalassolituus oleivorans TaxID=187493 RepID=UPI0023F66999|nr:TonB-dependent receptor [Thalassolituus oleivorans]
MMKPTRVLLTAASSLLASNLMAGEAVFYVTEDGNAMRDIAVSVNGQKQLVNSAGFATFDIPAGAHQVELSQFGEWLGEFNFDTASSEENAEVQVDIVGGEAMPEVKVYLPGQVDAMAVGQIAGALMSDETGGPVSGARIAIEGTDQAVMTDDNGEFAFELPRGEYALTIAHPNYGKRDVSGLRVMSGVTTGVNMTMSLSGNGVIEEVVAVGSYIPSTATAQERDSSAVLDAIGSEQMSRFGDSSAASALTRVAGVSVVGGQFAVVRGLAGRYISSTLNGSLMPSTDPMRRDVPLDLFPASVLGGIDIQKSFTPDLPGDSTGGSIGMTTKGMPDVTGGKVSATLGMNSRTTFSDVNGYEGGGTDFLGVDDGTREQPSFAESFTDGGNAFPRGTTSDEKINFTQSFDHTYGVQQVEAKPARGFSVSFGTLNEEGDAATGTYGAFSYNDKWTARHDAETNDSGVVGNYERTARKIDLAGYFFYGYEGANWEYQSRTLLLRKTDDTIKTALTNDVANDKEFAKTTLQWVERQYLGQQFSGTHHFDGFGDDSVAWRLGVAQTSRYEPDRRAYRYSRTTTGAGDFSLEGSIERRYSDLTESTYDLGVDYTSEILLDNWMVRNKAGLSFTTKDREVDLARYASNTVTAPVDATKTPDEIFNDANIESGLVSFAGSTTPTDDYKANEDISAVYLSSELDMDTVSVLAGLRYESVAQELTYPGKEENSTSKLDNSYVLPVISANWRVSEDTQVRASATQTVSRPGITERSESVQYDPETDKELIGNPDLEISHIDNFDLRGEYYFSDEESVSAALFYKNITDPIERGVPDADGSAAEGYTFRNVPSAELSGLELDFRVNYLETDSLSAFVSGNMAYVDSKVDLAGTDAERLEGVSSRELQGQSKYLGNLQLGFDELATGQSLTLLANYFDDRIYATSRGDGGAIIEKGRMTFDVVYRYDVTETFLVKAKVSNITDEAVRYTQDGVDYEKYYEGTDFSASVEYQF